MTDYATEAAVAASWPVWVIALATLALVAVRRRRRSRLPVEHPPREERPPVSLPPDRSEWRTLPPVSLPSALPDYRFTFACTVHWQPHPHAVAGHAAPGAVAVDAVVQRALRFTAGRDPRDDDAVHALADLLGRREGDPGRHVVAWATDVRLEPAPDDRDPRAADTRERQRVWDEEDAAERAVRAYLGQGAPTTTGSAVVWWSARDTGQVRDPDGPLARLTAGDREVDEGFRRRLASGASLPPFTVTGHGVLTEDVPPPRDDDRPS